MILKSMNIKNFRSYYGDNTFEFAQGLTLIIGDNGDGKTTFFEALEWLFDTATENKSATNISEKRKSEMEVGDIDEVVVSLVFDHDGIIEIEKSFSFEKQTENSARTFDYKFIGYEDRGSERLSRNGKQLLEACFDTAIRKYCLFKGESQLDVFDNNTALKTLVDTFSNIRQFEDYVDLTEKFERDSDAVVIKALKQDKAQTKKVQQLESDKIRNLNDIQNVKDDIRTQEQAISDFTSSLEKLEENQDACEAYQEIKKRIEAKQNEVATYKARTSIDYNAQLLDDYWILRAFPSVLKEFQKKASAISREKRKLDRAETERRAIEKGKQEMANALANGATKLPWYVPNKETMQEMIDDEICKVCNRPAHKGTPE
ncbi:ATP-binding protein [Porphyromonas gingivalis]|nr:ATP-binding protein [Porphyromonas gingivalis]MDP0532058.1 ATP-binding protein [Porphyromonas gingivalis]